MKRRLIQLVVTVGLLAMVIWFVDFRRAFELLRRVSLLYGALALGFLLLQNELATRRWETMLRAFGPPPTHFRMLRIQYSALFAQLFLPTSVGAAVVRTGLLFKCGTPFGVAMNSVVLDRIVALAGLVLLAVAFTPLISVSFSVGDGWHTSAAALLSFVVAGLLAFYGLLRWRNLAFWLDLAKRTAARHIIEPFEDAVARIRSPARLLTALAFSLAGQIAAIVAIFLLAMSAGLNVGLMECLLVMPPVMFLSALPISIAGWGVRESAMVVGFGMLGVSHEAALALSIQFAVLGYLAAAPGAVCWIAEADRWSRRRLRLPARFVLAPKSQPDGRLEHVESEGPGLRRQ